METFNPYFFTYSFVVPLNLTLLCKRLLQSLISSLSRTIFEDIFIKSALRAILNN